MVEALLERLVLIHDSDVADLVELVKALDSVLDELSELDSALNRVRHALDHDVVSWGWRGSCCGISLSSGSSVEELMCSLEVAADTDATLDANLVRGKHFLGLLNAHVLVCHLLSKLFSKDLGNLLLVFFIIINKNEGFLLLLIILT